MDLLAALYIPSLRTVTKYFINPRCTMDDVEFIFGSEVMMKVEVHTSQADQIYQLAAGGMQISVPQTLSDNIDHCTSNEILDCLSTHPSYTQTMFNSGQMNSQELAKYLDFVRMIVEMIVAFNTWQCLQEVILDTEKLISMAYTANEYSWEDTFDVASPIPFDISPEALSELMRKATGIVALAAELTDVVLELDEETGETKKIESPEQTKESESSEETEETESSGKIEQREISEETANKECSEETAKTECPKETVADEESAEVTENIKRKIADGQETTSTKKSGKCVLEKLRGRVKVDSARKKSALPLTAVACDCVIPSPLSEPYSQSPYYISCCSGCKKAICQLCGVVQANPSMIKRSHLSRVHGPLPELPGAREYKWNKEVVTRSCHGCKRVGYLTSLPRSKYGVCKGCNISQCINCTFTSKDSKELRAHALLEC